MLFLDTVFTVMDLHMSFINSSTPLVLGIELSCGYCG